MASDTSENISNIYIIYKYIIFILLYSYIVFEQCLGVVKALPSGKFGPTAAFFGIFWRFLPFQWPPRTPPMIWVNFYYFIWPFSISGTSFILVWYLSGVIWKVIFHVRKSEWFWNLKIRSVGSLMAIFSNFKTTHFFEHGIWSFKWPQTCTKPI